MFHRLKLHRTISHPYTELLKAVYVPYIVDQYLHNIKGIEPSHGKLKSHSWAENHAFIGN